jgi:hypothetical protein
VKTVDALREMEKVVETLERTAECLTKKNESDAALHLSDRVLYSPLTTEVIAAHQAAMKVRDALLQEDIT